MSRPHSLILAAGLFSIVPMPVASELTRDDARRALRWFPLLGALIGLAGGLIGALLLLVSDAHLLAAVLTVLVWQGLTGGMHLDGLADSFDGLAALGSRKEGRDANRALAVMHTPDTGAMGVAAIVLVLLTQVAALAGAPDARALLVLAVLAPATGRAAVLLASRPGVPAARSGGFGALFSEATSPTQMLAVLAGLAGLAAGLGWLLAGGWGAVGLTAAVVLALSVSAAWTKRLVGIFGGLTGDIFGALIEITSTVMAVGGMLALCWV